MRILLVSSLLIATGCGTHVEIDHKSDISGYRNMSVDAELLPMVNFYFATCEQMGIQCESYHLSVKVGDPGTGRAGVCQFRWGEGGRLQHRIIIAPSYKDNFSVLFHELEHCTRFQEHTDGAVPHVMGPIAMHPETLAERPMEDWLHESLTRDVRFFVK